MVDNFPLGRFKGVFSLQEAAEVIAGASEDELQLRLRSPNPSPDDARMLSQVKEIREALYRGLIDGSILSVFEEQSPGSSPIQPVYGPVDFNSYWLSRQTLIHWAQSHDLDCPFEPEGDDSQPSSKPLALTDKHNPCYCPILHAVEAIAEQVNGNPVYEVSPKLVVEYCLEQIAPSFSTEQKEAVKKTLNHRTSGGRHSDDATKKYHSGALDEIRFPDGFRIE